MSYADQVFIQNCKEILAHGTWDTALPVRPCWEDGESAHTVKRFGLVNRYDLRREFPVQTIRKMAFRSAVDELLWIWQKKSSNIGDLHSHIWDAWADETGSIGKAYGYQLGVKHRYREGWFDQVDRVLYDLRHDPASRRILTSLYNHHDLHEMHLYPCAWSVTFNVTGNVLNAVLNQRSQDMLTANGWNVMQYAVLLHMFAAVSDLVPGELVHVIADAHIYDRHVPIVEEIISREPYPAPTLWMDPAAEDFYSFTPDSFRLEGYRAWPLERKIPVAV
ncbi:thymidylate synthase [Intestinimonas butyriciproducens]|uniref:Thymidylate synthase n=1 Tax=Intestinimonas butyriciproducens TaxID=1297617 RepID=A0A0S2W130_9FIRM|nr:thymidylate synthase [Intestinimonas butyriciproducens]ALP92959.1 Thymidylate synthase [Intestinimonas butyriciproducens]